MSPRTALLGLMWVIGIAGQIAAAPPVNPLVEGREPDPVAREYHQADLPIGGYVPAPTASEQGMNGGWLVLSAVLWDVLLDHMTVPLGTAVVPERDDGCGA
jgi:hypothetical protein